MIAAITSIAVAAVIFNGEQASHLVRGIDHAPMSAVLVGLIVALIGSSMQAIAISQDRTALIMVILATVLLTFMATTPITGAFLYTLGLARVGGLMRFIPSSVLGGFFAGTGWLLLIGGLRFRRFALYDGSRAHLDQ